jgi:hypothetical protein
MALVGTRRVPTSLHAAPSRAFPDTPDAHATDRKVYLAVVTVPAAADDDAGAPVVEYLEPPAAHATDDLAYELTLTVTGQDTSGGSTAVFSWVAAD